MHKKNTEITYDSFSKQNDLSINKQIELLWQVGHSSSKDELPEKFFLATVPGAVQLDYAKHYGWDDYSFGDNWKQYFWMEDVYWRYKANFSNTTKLLNVGKKIFFCCLGIDYKYDILINGQIIYSYEGMFAPINVDLSDYLKEENLLEIIIYPAPKREGKPEDRTQASLSTKPAVSYGWDFHPRLIPLGIWDEAWIEVREKSYIENIYINTVLHDEFKTAEVKIDLIVIGEKNELNIHIISPNNQIVAEKTFECIDKEISINMVLEDPELWWPIGYGEQSLYEVKIFLKNQDIIIYETKYKIGFKQIKLLMYDGALQEPVSMPATRNVAPTQLQINGLKIFIKGSNLVPADIFPGKITKEKYEELIQNGLELGINLFRVWGGGIVNKESFFELCNESGIMVWQEFPLSCNNYEDDEVYLNTLYNEATAIIKRVKKHPCNVIWCGGNELFNSWSGMTDQSHALRLLNKLCYELDKETPFLSTSPLYGMAHGYYLFKDNEGREVYEFISQSSYTAYTEFGCPSVSDLETLKQIIPENEFFPVRPGTAWQSHHGIYAWQEDSWNSSNILEHYFGNITTINELILFSNILQCESYKCIFEESRRQQPKCTMAINWCFNEPWTTAAGNNLINWSGRKKPAFYSVKQSLRKSLFSAKNLKFSWVEGEFFEAELWFLNDGLGQVNPGKVEAVLQIGEKTFSLLEWNPGLVKPQSNIRGPRVGIRLPKEENCIMTLNLNGINGSSYSSEYKFLYKNNGISHNIETPKLNI